MSNLNEIREELEQYEDSIINLIKSRIQLGEAVAKIKYPSIKEDLTENNIMELITNQDVENKILERIQKKSNNEVLGNIIVGLYKYYIIPETKNVQLEYLKNKLN